jgi:uncharacterized protein (TIGR02099 family)
MTVRMLRALWLLLAVLLGLAAAALTAARLLVPMLGEYRHEAERLASAALHRPVSIERMEASWHGFNPVLKFKGISIGGAGIHGGQFAVDQIWISLDLFHYLIDRQIRLAGIDIIGADVDVIRDREGRIYLDRLQDEAGAADSSVSFPADLEGGRYSLERSNITYHDLKTGRPALHFSNVSLTLENSGQRHVINGNVMLPEQLGQRLAVHAEFTGPLETLNNWRGHLYVTGHSLAIMPDILKDVAPGIDAMGTADIRGWVDFGAGRMRSVTAEVELHNARLRHKGSDRTEDYAADQISGLFGWRRRENDDWQFAARDVVVTRDGIRQSPTQVTLSRRDVGGKAMISCSGSGLFLQDLEPLVELFPGIDVAQRERFVHLHPMGLVESFAFRFEVPKEGTPRLLRFDVSLRDLDTRPASDLPGIGGLTATATGSQEGGTFWIHSQDFIYQDGRLFTEPLHFDEFSGEGTWQYQAGRLSIKSDALHLLNGDLDAGIRLAFERQPDEPAPRLDLQVAVNRFQLEAIGHYLPVHVMSKEGAQWLERALVSGAVRGGNVVLQGRLDQLPFDQGEGRLEARLPVRDAVLDFSPGWTPIRGLDAQVDFTGRSMDIRSRHGKIRTANLVAVQAQIKDLVEPDLTLQGTVQGDLPVMLTELGSCPLGEIYGGFVDHIESGGAAGLSLDLLVPLHHEDQETEVRGNIILKDNRLKVMPDGPELNHIKGQLAFSNNGINGNALKAQLLDAPVSVDVATNAEAGVTRIDLTGAPDLASYLAGEWPEPAARIAGRSDWDMELAIGRLQGRKEVPDVDLKLVSDLQGISIDLPEPLGKTAQESRQFAIDIDHVSKPVKTLHFSYGDQLQGVCAVHDSGDGMACTRANVHLGVGKAVLPEAKLLYVSGHLPAFSLTRWQPLLEGAGSGPGLPVRLDLTIDDFEVMQHAVRDVTLRSEESGRVQKFTLDGPGSAGTIELARTGAGLGKITMNLERLFLEKHAVPGATNVAKAQAGSFPELQVTIRKLRYDGVDYGELQLQALHKEANALHLKRLLLDSGKLRLEASGDWKTLTGKNLSQFDVEVKDGKLGTLLKELDYKEDMSGGKLSASFHGSWQGVPWEVSPDRVNGKLHVLIKDGRLLGVEPGAGRVLGLLSLHTLQRRLSLDFSDLFSKGFAFDRIEGNFVLDNGNAYTDDLIIKGPAARIEISGRIGLANKDYDELVTVIPSMTSSIPIAGAIAGGPAVGAALFVAERLLSDELEKASSFTHRYYSVTGPWSDPVFTKIEPPSAKPADKTPPKVSE